MCDGNLGDWCRLARRLSLEPNDARTGKSADGSGLAKPICASGRHREGAGNIG